MLVIEPDRLGITKGKKPTVWSERAGIGFVRVTGLPYPTVWLYSLEGKLLDTYAFFDFDPKELRQAFREAGIPER